MLEYGKAVGSGAGGCHRNLLPAYAPGALLKRNTFKVQLGFHLCCSSKDHQRAAIRRRRSSSPREELPAIPFSSRGGFDGRRERRGATVRAWDGFRAAPARQ